MPTMFRFPAGFFVSFILVCMIGCAGNQKGKVPQGYLATHIFDDDSKQFVFSVDLPDSPGTGKRGKGSGRPGNISGNVQGSSSWGVSGGITAGTGSGRKGGRNPNGQGQQAKVDSLVNALEAELKKTGYCRKGFMELDRMTEPSQTFIKGECVEAASANDRAEFPNVSA